MPKITPVNSVRDLRRKWKPTKLRFERTGESHPLAIRLHRAFSWLARVEASSNEDEDDEQLLFLWIAFNALYGRWDRARSIPRSDADGIKTFVRLIQKIDQDQILAKCLLQNKSLAIKLISDQYLNKRFWRTINVDRSFNCKKSKYLANTWFNSNNTMAILDELLDRIYFNRCQLFHGAATYNSKLNRESVKRSVQMLNELLRAMIFVIIENGIFENWDELCYPPIEEEKTIRTDAISIAKPK